MISNNQQEQILTCGPFTMILESGQLRYITCGSEEIIRRIYLSVRDADWDTIEAVVNVQDIKQDDDKITIALNATNAGNGIHFDWEGTFTCYATGSFEIAAQGTQAADCKANRFGFCVLLGAAAVSGLPFKNIRTDGSGFNSEFPVNLHKVILDDQFTSLSYQTRKGTKISITASDAVFGMEDQRFFSDSSFKMFSSMAQFVYPNITKGSKGSQKLKIEVSGGEISKQAFQISNKHRVTIEGLMPQCKIPRLHLGDPMDRMGFFMDVYDEVPKVMNDGSVRWTFNSSVNQFDCDTFNENLAALIDQARSVKHHAPDLKLVIEKLSFTAPFNRSEPDFHNTEPYAAAYLLATLKYLALAGISEASLNIGPGYAHQVFEQLKDAQGSSLLATKIENEGISGRKPIEVLAVSHEGKIHVWLLNLSPDIQEITLKVDKTLTGQTYLLLGYQMVRIVI